VKALLGVLSVVSVLVSGGTAAADTPFASAVFKATHNSYSGNVEGSKNSLTYQLDHGVRYLELDIHDNGYGSSGDYGVGHDSPGHQVDHSGGNPASNGLREWLRTVDTWSAAHTDHAPIVVMLDLKDDLTDNASFAAGNLSALNQELAGVFGSRLVLAKDHPSGLPSVDALRGKVLTLLSGDGKSRTEYRRDVGYHPAVALNGRGQIVEVHDSGSGSLWYWTGTYGADGRVTWLRHGRFDTGKTPAVALNDNGQLVEVHDSGSGALWYRTGKLGSDGEITWSMSRKYDSGVLPTVRFTDPASTTVREIHRSQGSSQNWAWKGVFDGDGVVWSGNAKTSDARYDVTVATRGSSRVSVWTGADGASSAQTLRYSTDRVTGQRIRYEQTAFVEFQEGNSAELKQDALFYAAPAGSKSFITASRQAGRIVRGWDFDSAGQATSPLANYPATNRPYEGWYLELTAGAVR